MIVTLTLNPSLDRTIEIGSLSRGAVIRAAATRLDPGGKGVNVSRALLANRIRSRAVVPFGGDEGRQLVSLLSAEGIDMVTVPVSGPTRSNVALAEPDGTVTKINEPGTALSPAELDTVAEVVLSAAGSADWVVASGSLPPEVPSDVYARLCRRFGGAGINVAVDTSGPALAAAVAASPALVKPNREELGEVTGMAIMSLGDAIEAARRLRDRGARTVLASLGPDGAVLLQDDRSGTASARWPSRAAPSARATPCSPDSSPPGPAARPRSSRRWPGRPPRWGFRAAGCPPPVTYGAMTSASPEPTPPCR